MAGRRSSSSGDRPHPQLLGRVRSRFRDGVAVLHSGLTRRSGPPSGERSATARCSSAWGALRHLLPFPSVGSSSWTRSTTPRTSRRTVCATRRGPRLLRAAWRSRRSAGVRHTIRRVVPPGATGAATLLSLPSDRRERHAGNLRGRSQGTHDRRAPTATFPELEAAIEATLARGEKALALPEPAGVRAALTCLECGTTVQCPNCQVALTYHREHEALLCHYCT